MTDPALIAQPRAARTLERLLDAGRAHALLLAGEPGNGPLAAAARVAERVLCPNGGGDDCAVCGRVARRVHPDLHWIAPEGGALAIDQIRDVVDVVGRMPFEAAAQVVVIEAADTLSGDNAAAGNSLLKALEEPVGRVVFVLVARRVSRILPTIRSRSIELVFPPVPDAAIVTALESEGVDAASVAAASGLDLPSLARVARGDLERARSLATGGDAAMRRAVLLPVLERVAAGRDVPSVLADAVVRRASDAGERATASATAEFEAMLERMSSAEQRSFQSKSNDQGMEKRTARRARRARVQELRACLDEVGGWWRDVLAVSVDAALTVANVDRIEGLRTVAAGPAAGRAVAAIDAVDEADARLQLNNADEAVTIAALAAELAGLAGGRIRARRTLGAPARTPAGYDLSLG